MLRRDTINFTGKAMICLSLLSIGVFKIVQGKMYAPYLWLELKIANNVLATAVTTALIMFQYPLTLVMLYPMISMRFISCVVPIPEAYDFSWKKYGGDLVRTILWLALIIVATIFLLFGTLLEQT